MTSRILAVLLVVFAVEWLAYMPAQFQAIEDVAQVDPQGSPLIRRGLIALPFAVEAILAAFFWLRAEAFAKAIVPDSSPSSVPVTRGDLARVLTRVIGIYLIVSAIFPLANWLVYVTYEDIERKPFVQLILGANGLPNWVGPTLQLIIGVVLFIGTDRIANALRGADRFMRLDEPKESED